MGGMWSEKNDSCAPKTVAVAKHSPAAPPSYCNKCGEMFLLDNVADAAFTMYYGVEVVRYFLLLMLFLFLSKLSERSERGLRFEGCGS